MSMRGRVDLRMAVQVECENITWRCRACILSGPVLAWLNAKGAQELCVQKLR